MNRRNFLKTMIGGAVATALPRYHIERWVELHGTKYMYHAAGNIPNYPANVEAVWLGNKKVWPK